MYNVNYSGSLQGYGNFGAWSKSKEMNKNVVHSPAWYGEHWWRRELRRDVIEKARKNAEYAYKHRFLVLSAAQAQHADFELPDGTRVSDYVYFFKDAKTPNPAAQENGEWVFKLSNAGYQRVGKAITDGDGTIKITWLPASVQKQLESQINYRRLQDQKAAEQLTEQLVEATQAPTLAVRNVMPIRVPLLQTGADGGGAQTGTGPSEGAGAQPQQQQQPSGERTPEQLYLLMQAAQQEAQAEQEEAGFKWWPVAVGVGAGLVVVGGVIFLIGRKKRKAKEAAEVAGLADARRERMLKKYGYDYTTGEGQKRLMYESAGIDITRRPGNPDWYLPEEYGHDPIFDAAGNPTGKVRMVPTGRIVNLKKKR